MPTWYLAGNERFRGAVPAAAAATNLLLDNLSATAITAVSAKKLRAGYLGNAFQAITSAPGHAMQDIPFVGNDVDASNSGALRTFITASHDGGISRFYDQSTTGNDLTLGVVGATNDQSPLVVNSGTVQVQNGRVCPQFVSAATGVDAFFDFSQIGNTASAVIQPFTIAVCFSCFSLAATTGLIVNVGGSTVALGLNATVYILNSGSSLTGGTTDTNFHTLIGVFNGNSSTITLDGTVIVGPGVGGGNSLYGAAGAISMGTGGSRANIAAFIIFNSAISGTDATTIHTTWQTDWNSL